MSNFEIKKWELLGSYGKAIFPIVYCPNLVNFMYPLHESLKSVLRHFFPSKRMLNVYSSTSGLDMDGSVFSLLNLYCTSCPNQRPILRARAPSFLSSKYFAYTRNASG